MDFIYYTSFLHFNGKGNSSRDPNDAIVYTPPPPPLLSAGGGGGSSASYQILKRSTWQDLNF